MKSSMTKHATLGITISHARFSRIKFGTGYMAIEKQLSSFEIGFGTGNVAFKNQIITA